MAKKHKHEEHVNHERWLVSYADFITLLFATFTALFAISNADKEKYMKFARSVKEAFNDSPRAVMELPNVLSQGGTDRNGNLIITINNSPSSRRNNSTEGEAEGGGAKDDAGAGQVPGAQGAEPGEPTPTPTPELSTIPTPEATATPEATVTPLAGAGLGAGAGAGQGAGAGGTGGTTAGQGPGQGAGAGAGSGAGAGGSTGVGAGPGAGAGGQGGNGTGTATGNPAAGGASGGPAEGGAGKAAGQGESMGAAPQAQGTPDVGEGQADPVLADEIQQLIEVAGLEGKVEVRKEKRGMVISLGDSAFFAPGDVDIVPESTSQLDRVINLLRNKKLDIRVEGHTDDTPIRSRRYRSNLELSTLRASRIADFMVSEYGFPPAQVSSSGYGEWRPIADNKTAEGRARNRRVDIVVLSRREEEKEPQAEAQQTGKRIIEATVPGDSDSGHAALPEGH